jgi:dTMP kinase
VKEDDYPGTFIVVEGADGAGTTTQSKKLAEELDAHWTYEPSGNKVGEKVDEMISSEDYSPQAIALGFAADRLVHLEEEVIPKLENGETVVCDRYYHSSLVYQPVLGAEFEWVRDLNSKAVKPDKTVILDISAEVGMERLSDRGSDGDIFEGLDFQEKVVVKYRELESKLEEDIAVVDAKGGRKQVFSSIMSVIPDR